MSVCVHGHASAGGGQKNVLSMELESQTVVRLLMRVLGTKLGFSTGAVGILNL